MRKFYWNYALEIVQKCEICANFKTEIPLNLQNNRLFWQKSEFWNIFARVWASTDEE